MTSMEEVSLLKLVLLVAVGILSGFINVLAGGGIFLTLPALMFLGLPATVANGTNRIGILMQNIGAIQTFRRAGHFPIRLSLILSIPAVAGSLLGARWAVTIGDEAFQKALAVIMLAVTLLAMWNPKGRTLQKSPPGEESRLSGWQRAGLLPVFFVIGIYGGFVQAGIGFLIIASLVLLGLDLLRISALKLIVIFILTIPACVVFVFTGKMVLWAGLILGVGNVIGAKIASRKALQKGHEWIRKVVTVAVLMTALGLLLK